VGDYHVAFDIYIETVPGFDTTISQVKCGSGKPPVNVKLTAGGGVRVQSAGGSPLAATSPGILGTGWHRVEYTIENSRKALTLAIDGTALPIDNAQVETDCARIPDAGPDYWLKIGLYEDNIVPGYRVFYGNLSLRPLP
jgi:hypothetical protein